jgi:hypothetical protein
VYVCIDIDVCRSLFLPGYSSTTIAIIEDINDF